MNKILNLSAIITVFFALSVIVSAQENPSANELFKKYADALGGKETAKKITSRVSKGTVELSPTGVTGTFENYQKAPNKIFVAMNLTGFGNIVDGCNGKESWSQDPISGLRVKEGEELEKAKTASDFQYDFNLDKYYPAADVTGKEKVNEVEAYVVKADEDTTLYFDITTSLLLKTDRIMIYPQGKISVQTYHSNYQEVDGIKIPFENKQIALGAELISKTTEVKQNVEVEDSKFNKPQ